MDFSNGVFTFIFMRCSTGFQITKNRKGYKYNTYQDTNNIIFHDVDYEGGGFMKEFDDSRF